MKTCDLCNTFGEQLNSFFTSLEKDVSSKEKRVKSHHWCLPGTAAHPLLAYITFSFGEQSDDDVIVIEIEFWLFKGTLQFNCDIMKDNQHIIDEIPVRYFHGALDSEESYLWAQECINDGMRWLNMKKTKIITVITEYCDNYKKED